MFERRIKDIKKKLVKDKLDAVLVSNVSNITYLTGYANFSKDEREAYLLIGHDFQHIITDGRYSEVIRRGVPHFKLLELSGRNSLKNIFAKFKHLKVLGIEEDEITISEHKMLKKHFRKMKHMDIKSHRSIKTDDEIKKIMQAAKLGDKAFKYILGKIKNGITEKELAYELESFIKKNGAELSFPPIVAFGKNSSVPHHQTGHTILDPSTLLRQAQDRSGPGGLFILLDFGVKLENYCSDMTRTIFLGSPSKKQEEIYGIVLEAQQKAVDHINSSIKSGKKLKTAEVDEIARKYIVSKGYPTIPHSLGHGIGLEVHEQPSLSPKSKEILKKGMVFSIEPGIYLSNFGSPRVEAGGVRIEDLFVLETDKLRQITSSSKEIISI